MLIIASHVWITDAFQNSISFEVWNNILNSFYVPLFFILSGVFEPQSFDIHKTIRRLVKLLIYILIFAIFGFLSMGVVRHTWELSSCIRGTTIWFLLTLFWITIIFAISKRIKYKLFIYSILIGGGAIL